MKYTVYVLYSSTFGRHYTGYTSDLPNRLLSHNCLGKDWTARYRPWVLIYSKEFMSQEEAMIYEKWLKSGGMSAVYRVARGNNGLFCVDLLSFYAQGNPNIASAILRDTIPCY